MQTEQRNSALDAVKGFAILLVMLGHCIVLNGLNETDPYIYDAIKSVQMPLFMAVSGAVAGLSYAKKQSVEIRILKKRAFSYLVPFFSWFVLVFLWTHILDGTIGVRLFGVELCQLLFQTDRGLWFLTTLFEISAVVLLSQYLSDFCCKNKNEKCQVVKRLTLLVIFSLGFYLLFFLQGRSGFLLFSPSLAVMYMPFYVIFYVFFGYRELLIENGLWKINQKLQGIIGAILCVFFLVYFAWMVISQDLNRAPQGMIDMAMLMMISFAGTYVIFYLVYQIYGRIVGNSKEHKKMLMPWIGMYTLEIYVLHFRFARVLHVSEKNVSFYSMQGLGYLLASFVIMSVCTAVCIVVLKKIPFLNKILFGKK